MALPSSPACAALALALPGVLLLGVELVSRASRDRGTALAVGPGVGVAWLLVTIYVVARVVGSFDAGLVVGVLLTAAFGVALGWRRVVTRRLPRPSLRKAWPVLATATLLTLAIVPAVLRNFHDELILAGHWGTIGQLQNGHFPPRFPVFPEHEFRYHYGFNVLAAVVSAIFRLPTPTAIDVTTCLLWAYVAAVAARLGKQVAGARHGVIAALLVLLGGGVAFLCVRSGAPTGQILLGQCTIGAIAANPPTCNYFMQHPFAPGIAFGLCTLSLHLDRDRRGMVWRYASFFALFLALGLSHIVVFATFGASVAAAELLVRGRGRARRIVGTLVAATAALAAAAMLGGFFVKSPQQASSLSWHLGIADTLTDTLLWHVASLGVLLPLGTVGLFFVQRGRLALALIIFGSLAVANAVRYEHSWDIVKFVTVATLASSISASALLVRLAKLKVLVSRRHAMGLSCLIAVLLAGGTGAGGGFVVAYWANSKGTHVVQPVQVESDDIAMMNYLRKTAGPRDLVYRAEPQSVGYNQWAGLNSPWPGWPTRQFGYGAQILPRLGLLRASTTTAAEFSAIGLRWFVIEPREVSLLTRARQWAKDGEAELVRTHGKLSLYRMTGPPGP
ncbi:MAG: hypothetical protein R3B13_13975 [Polyangiaceae bacterium]